MKIPPQTLMNIDPKFGRIPVEQLERDWPNIMEMAERVRYERAEAIRRLVESALQGK